jgi:hypothetical protein
MQLVQKVDVIRGQHGDIWMSNCFPSFIVRWILDFMDQLTHKNWYPMNKSDFTVLVKAHRWVKWLANRAHMLFKLLAKAHSLVKWLAKVHRMYKLLAKAIYFTIIQNKNCFIIKNGILYLNLRSLNLEEKVHWM